MVEAHGSFLDEVRTELEFLTRDHGFWVISDSDHVVELESSSLWAQAVWDRGQVEVHVGRLGVSPHGRTRYGRWTYSGMIGRASRVRLLQLAAEGIRAQPAVLSGDPEFYDRLERDQRRRGEEWTAYYERKGPRPPHGPLP